MRALVAATVVVAAGPLALLALLALLRGRALGWPRGLAAPRGDVRAGRPLLLVATLSAALMISCARAPRRAPPPSPGPPEHVWSRVYGDAAWQEANSVALDGAGNAYVVGTFRDTFVDGDVRLGRERSCCPLSVLKLDAAGEVLWARSFDGEGANSRASVARVSPSGNVIVAGTTRASSIDFGGGALRNAGQGTSDLVVVALAPDGRHVWSRIFGGRGSEWIADGLAVDEAGDVYVAFRSDSPAIELGSAPVANAGPPGTTDTFVVKLDRSGAVVWASRFGGVGDERPEAIAVNARGGVYVGAELRRPRGPGGGPHRAGERGVAVLEVDRSGRVTWSKEIDGTSVGGVVAGHDDALVVTGAYYGQLYLAAFAPGGGELWRREFGTTAIEQPSALFVEPCGDLVLAGDYGAPPVDLGGGPLATGEPVMIFLAGFDRGGAHLWSRGHRGTNSTVFPSAALAGGDLWLADTLWGPIDLGGGPLVQRGGGDVFVARFAVRSRCGR